MTADDVRALLAELTGRPELAAVPDDTALFAEPVALDSLVGTLLLRRIEATYGVDVADEDVNLDALASVRTLADFVTAHAAGTGR